MRKCSILCAAFAAVLLFLSVPANAVELGGSVVGNYYTTAPPAGWYPRPDVASQRYHASETIYVKKGILRFAVQAEMAGRGGSPTYAAGTAGIGLQLGSFLVGAFHHSCHDLDTAPNPIYSAGTYTEPPACQYNGAVVRMDLGTTFLPPW